MREKTLRIKAIGIPIAILVALSATAAASGDTVKPAKPPKTGFETSDGAAWTTHEQELKFLKAVDDQSRRVSISVIGKTAQKRPLHLVKIGNPAPASPEKARRQPTVLFVCSQHGNEPAGREACLQLLRDLAFSQKKDDVSLLSNATVLVVPSANPDGRAANTRENTAGIDINRDHLNLVSPEAQAVARVVRDWKPELVMDLHEYGPSVPAVYDDELLYLWPRNLNVHQGIHDLSKSFVDEYIEPGAEAKGYRADEYGQYELADQDFHQSAGDGDEGIARNAMGLRHSLGILVESAVTEDPRNGPGELTSAAELNRRRVNSHLVVVDETLRFIRERGNKAAAETVRASRAKTIEGKKQNAPVYWGGADNAEPEEAQILENPPCRYDVSAQDAKSISKTLSLLGIRSQKRGKSLSVPVAQPAEPLIPLLLDERGLRHSVAAKPVNKC
jgi:Zinc carboxypeptidase